MVEARKYALTRVRAGNYLFPSNDDRWLWWIYSYTEYGTLSYEVGPNEYRTITGRFWACARRPMPKPDAVMDDDFFYSYEWAYWDGLFKTRKEAIDAAMKATS